MLNIPNEIKSLFLDDSILKNIRIHFPNGEHEDITNYNLEEESFSFTESVCSEDTLKFGLCESAVVQFVTKGIGNIKGMEIQCQIEIDISSLKSEFINEYGQTSSDVPFPFYPVTLGYFTVKSCPKDSIADTESRSIKAYDKLSSQALDYDKTEQLNKYFASDPVCVPRTVYTLERLMLQDFNINHERTMVPVEFKHSLGDSTSSYTGNLVSVNGEKTTFEVRTRTYKFQNIDSDEIYDAVFSNVGMFIQLQSLLKYYKDKYSFTMGSDDYWWLSHGLQIELTDGNSNTVVFNEVYDDEGYLSAAIIKILGYGNISEMKFSIVSYINLHFYEDEMDEEGRDVQQSIDSETVDALIDSITLESLTLYDIERKSIPSVLSFCTLRNVLNAVYEINGTFASINRMTGMLEERSIGGFGLYPSETLYPGDLYPGESSDVLSGGLYTHAVYDDGAIEPYGKIIAHYKTTDKKGNTVDAVYEYKFREDGTTYNLNSNWILQNCIFSEEEVANLCEYMAENIRHITYTPCEVATKGLPWIEAGDTLEILTKKGGFESFVLRRTLSGIQGLIDDIESRG